MSGRKALLRQYRERKVEAGIYAVRCAVTGEAWIGATPDLSTRQSGIWFSLGHGAHREASLQTAWKTHGPDAFVFDALEVVDIEGLDRFGRDSRLKARRSHWIAALNGKGLM
ncbi:GIY-YIG nuclease family protein [uncultured Caulobacter sp.]|uniref:GIY-YIG nuclease family protein n=1 Tax=uncultured Caulobacter sp. TaxID=158749 RepID=UPI0026142C62|nr:GIY-YIG nuclease family protein [uncultured Caulobacter sp.]